jgi:MarR family transcriptional regulator, transcriptional regulator for hemolysin
MGSESVTAFADEQRLETNLCFLLKRAGHMLTKEITAAFEAVGVSPRAHHVLAAARTGEHTQIELARMLGIDKTTMVVTLDELEASGLAERRPSRVDRRARVIAVTDAGERLVREGYEIVARIHDDVLNSLPPDDRQPFLDALYRLVNERLRDPASKQPA